MRVIMTVATLVAISPSLSAQWIVQSGYGFSFGGPRNFSTTWSASWSVQAPCFAPTFRPWNLAFQPPVVVIVPQPVIVIPTNYNLLDFGGQEAERFAERPAERRPVPNPNQWHVVRPVNQPAFPVVPKPDLQPAAPLDVVEERIPDVRRESVRQVRLAQSAFDASEYGRAVERLRESIRLQPKEPLPYFLLAQVHFARGEYTESVAAILEGLKIAPDWPATEFSPRPLYANQPGALDRQLEELKTLALRKPEDVTLQFLLAYQLWIKGDRDGATKLFRQLAPIVRDRAVIELFLNVTVGRLVKR